MTLPVALLPVATAAPATPSTRLPAEVMVELIFKILYVQGTQSGRQVLERLAVSARLMDAQLRKLRDCHLIEQSGSATGNGNGDVTQHLFELTRAGRERAREALAVYRRAYPRALDGRCGAEMRGLSGTRFCRRWPLPGQTRCRFHGDLELLIAELEPVLRPRGESLRLGRFAFEL